jgi:hypothetical protein
VSAGHDVVRGIAGQLHPTRRTRHRHLPGPAMDSGNHRSVHFMRKPIPGKKLGETSLFL